MEQTDGRARLAEVWVNGTLLSVMDDYSAPQRKCPPGVIDEPRFVYTSDTRVDWAQAIGENPSKRKVLEPLGQWAYEGYGQVVSIMPVVIDFGLLRMEDPNWTNDEHLVGRYVKVPIDRLALTRATEPDWPDWSDGTP